MHPHTHHFAALIFVLLLGAPFAATEGFQSQKHEEIDTGTLESESTDYAHSGVHLHAQVSLGDRIVVQLAEGRIRARVESAEPDPEAPG